MKDKWKNLSIALIIAVIITGICATFVYYTVLKPLKEGNMGIDGEENMPVILYSVPEEAYQPYIYGAIVFLIVIFCITTVLFYIVIERLRKRKN
jgi:riboflavin transporter FmnP